MNAPERALPCHGGLNGRWLAPAAVSFAFHVGAAACFWPGPAEMSIGDPTPAIGVELVFISETVEASPPAGTPAASQPPAPQTAAAAESEVAEPPVSETNAAEPVEAPAPIVLAAATVTELPLPSKLESIRPARKPAQPQVRPTEAPLTGLISSAETQPTQIAAVAPALPANPGVSSSNATESPTALSEEPPATAVSAMAGVAVVLDPKFRRPPSPPSYPARSVELDQQGVVVVRALVTEPGTPRQTVVWQSSGYPLLDSAAKAAVSRWEFEPLRLGSVAQTAWVQVPVRFKLK